MKKLLVLIVLLLVGCSEKEVSEKILEVKLDSDSNTGYSWTYSIDNNILEETNNEFIPKTEGGTHIFKFKGLEPGNAIITFEYVKEYEENNPLYTVVYNVVINEDGVITEATTSSPDVDNLVETNLK